MSALAPVAFTSSELLAHVALVKRLRAESLGLGAVAVLLLLGCFVLPRLLRMPARLGRLLSFPYGYKLWVAAIAAPLLIGFVACVGQIAGNLAIVKSGAARIRAISDPACVDALTAALDAGNTETVAAAQDALRRLRR